MWSKDRDRMPLASLVLQPLGRERLGKGLRLDLVTTLSWVVTTSPIWALVSSPSGSGTVLCMVTIRKGMFHKPCFMSLCSEVGSSRTVFLAPLALLKEVESLTREQSEARKQSEKDRAVLLSQMRVLESELEDQLSQHQGCAQQAEEVATLKQQLAALDKHLRSQRQFMDVRSLDNKFYSHH
jgi:hypothetical protein